MAINKSVVSEARGVSYDEYYNKGMVQSRYESAESRRGIPVPESHVMHDPNARHYCEGVTKKGVACQARTVGDTYLCAGHARQVKSNESDGDN